MNIGLGLGRRATGRAPLRAVSSRLAELEDFGTNPGRLRAYHYVPPGKTGMPLVVALHGCTQTVAGYDTGTGWSDLAEAHGFAVLLPEQQRANNPNLCFNWFEPDDARRRTGEPLSIAQMIDTMVERHAIDPNRVYISGLSAGGAMTSIMLATYPEKFAGGAILAGLPHGAAASVPEAFQQMRGFSPTRRSEGRAIRAAMPQTARWPMISIWHGTADTVVDISNADGILRQWQEVHGTSERPAEEGIVDGHPRRAWHDAAGQLVIEEYRIHGMGHGVPLDTQGECGCGETGAFMLEAGISSTRHSARTWGLLDPAVKNAVPRTRCAPADRRARPGAGGIGQVIDDALRAAGLMR
jgi:poly(hydroxyalkanoate) depolymerase family esterase